MTAMAFTKELDFACSIAREAGALALSYQASGVSPESKADLSPVTIADTECEKLIVGQIHSRFPEDGLLGEEGSSVESHNRRRWIIDPIDGTRDFLRGMPLWGVLLALEVDGEVAVGVAHMPSRSETYFASKGGGAFLNGQKISVSSVADSRQAVISVNNLNGSARHRYGPKLLDWLAQFWAVRSMGGCMDAMMLARGSLDVWFEPQAQPWDLAAPMIILEEAGAHFFTFSGERTIYGGNCVGCVPALEPVVRSFLSQAASV